ncbi:hypothetical protein PINS_up021010 [Pythium insidiosum]|nr:hypothetical protein PINS_up021010 [Pythium insidiosum]
MRRQASVRLRRGFQRRHARLPCSRGPAVVLGALRAGAQRHRLDGGHDFPDAAHLLFQSLEIDVASSGIHHLRTHFQDGADLVVGAALPGHAFQPERPQPVPLDGLSTPWNTLALWDLRQLAKIGFPLVGDGLGVDGGAATAGVEEVSTIALYQHALPSTSAVRAKVVAVPVSSGTCSGSTTRSGSAGRSARCRASATVPPSTRALGSPDWVVYHLR